jgi:dTDP-4-dehydrorhamnose reductase
LRILILGGDGMLGHQLLKHFSGRHRPRVTLRQGAGAYRTYGLFDDQNTYYDIDIRSQDRILDVMADFRPEAVINAVGIVKQRPSAKESIPSLEINALLPHRLAVMCRAAGARLVHVSTDCVFSGRKGGYTEDDPSDAEDLYGKTKYLGEVGDADGVTLRTSIIGLELSRKRSLIEWFLAQEGPINGYTRAIYSGLTTAELSRVIEMLLLQRPTMSGLYNVSSEPISKFDLLVLLKNRLGLSVEIRPDDGFVCDRSLDSSRFRRELDYRPPSWPEMIDELARSIEGEGK